MKKRRAEAIAIRVIDTDGRILDKTVLLVSPKQADALFAALSSVDGIESTPVFQDFDVFGRAYWKRIEVDYSLSDD